MLRSGEHNSYDYSVDYTRNMALVDRVFTNAKGFSVEPKEEYDRITTPLGGKITFMIADAPEMVARAAISAALEVGAILPKRTSAILTSTNQQYTELNISGVVDEGLRQHVRDIPAALGIEDTHSMRLIINSNNLGARYQDPSLIVSDPEKIKQLHANDSEKLRASGLVDAMMQVAVDRTEDWHDIDKPELTAITRARTWLGHDHVSIGYITELKLSSGIDGPDDLRFYYTPGTFMLDTPFPKDAEPDVHRPIHMNLTNPQHYLLQAITARNQYAIHVEFYKHLQRLAAADPDGHANYTRMRQQGLKPQEIITITDPEIAGSGLVDVMIKALAGVDEEWANTFEHDRTLYLRTDLNASLDPRTGKLEVRRPMRINLCGWKAVGEPDSSLYRGLSSSLAYQIGSDIITPYSSSGLRPEAQATLTPDHVSLLSALIMKHACYIQGATIEQLAKGQPRAKR